MRFGFATYVAFPLLTQLNPPFWLNAICLSTQDMSANKFAISFVLKITRLNSFNKIGRIISFVYSASFKRSPYMDA